MQFDVVEIFTLTKYDDRGSWGFGANWRRSRERPRARLSSFRLFS